MSKTPRNKELNSSKSLTTESSENEARIRKLETLVTKISTQNDLLLKRLDELESRHSHQLKKSNSLQSFSTSTCLNNTLTDVVGDIIESEQHFHTAAAAFSTSSNTNSKNKPAFNDVLNAELTEWKKDIEKSIEKISEKVALSTGPSVLTTLLENRVNDTNNELNKLKKVNEENIEKYQLITSNLEKFERTDKIIRDLVNTIKTMRTGNEKMQEEMGKNLNEFQDKLQLQENIIETFEKFEESTNKKLVLVSEELSGLRQNDEVLDEKLKSLEDTSRHIIEENINLTTRFKEEIGKIEISTKALWDSFTLFTTETGK